MTKGEFAIEKDIFLASISFLLLITFTVINLDAPSPSATTLFARFNKTFIKDLLNLLNLGLSILFISTFDASPVAKIETISFVLVSPSQEIALNVFEIFFFNNFLRTFEEIDASVKTNPKVVAILGKIIPEPFAIP